jgi:ligand-binding sensor domain-containing protein
VWAIGEAGLFRFEEPARYTTSALPPGLAEKIQADAWFMTDFVVTADGAVWIGTNQDGLYRFQAGTWTHFGPAEGWPYQGVVSLAAGIKNQLWALARVDQARYLVRFDGQSWQEVPAPGEANELAGATNMALASSGELWLAIHDRVPYRYDGVLWLSMPNGWHGDSRDISVAAGNDGQALVRQQRRLVPLDRAGLAERSNQHPGPIFLSGGG